MTSPNFKFIKQLGKGAFGVTYLSVDDNGKEFAIKTINLDRLMYMGVSIDDILNEIDTLKMLSMNPRCYPYIACYYGYYRGLYENNDTLFIIMEYVKGPTLGELLLQKINYPPQELLMHMYQLILATYYIHKMGFAHRDLKPDNIILDVKTKTFKIVDFGTACTLDCKDITGTILWMPPELFNTTERSNSSLEFAQKHDIWSLGIILYELANQRFPFTIDPNSHLMDIIDQINSPIIPSSYHSNLSYYNDIINAIITIMLNHDWRKRPTSSDLKHIMEQYMLKLSIM